MQHEDLIPAKLVLANGTILSGFAPKWQQETTFGEVVFNTGMTGYEEALTDPSYSGQILTFTYPILGNYGVSDNKDHFESDKIHVQGIICQNIFTSPKHHDQVSTFLEWLQINNIPIISGIDTRYLTKIIRKYGVINGAFVFGDNVIPDKFPDAMLTDWVKLVSPKETKTYGNGKYKVILINCGSKQNILNNLLKFDVTVKVVPYNYDYLNEEYDGIFLSNGPGDPKMCIRTITLLKAALQQAKPVYGICLGSQLMGLAIGANTYKLKFGHRGQNQPCIDLDSGKCYLTSQNHGYAVEEASLPADWMVNYRHLNDNTVAGIRHKTKPLVAVQFHPEAAPGPHDSHFFFKQFIAALEKAELEKGKK